MTKQTLVCMAALVIAASGCKKEDDSSKGKGETAGAKDKKPTPKPTPKPKSVTDVVGACLSAIEQHSDSKLKECYAANLEFVAVDHEPSVAGGQDVAVQHAKSLWTSFPELGYSGRLTLANGNKLATVIVAKGIDEGGVLGAEASGKTYNAVHAALFELDDAGKIKRHRVWIDQSTLLKQLGLHESDSAPAAEQAWAKAPAIVAADSPEQTKNVEVVKAHIARFVAGKDAAELVKAGYTDGATFRYIPDGESSVGTEKVTARVAAYLAPNSELAVEVLEIWPAKNWVVARTQTQATIAKGLKGAEALGGKKWKGEYLELYELADGKIKTGYVFANNLRFETDLGLFDPKSIAAPAAPKEE